MSGIFLSYSRADRVLADQVIQHLRALGAEVWWDEDMPGVNWQRELGRQIHELAAVLVIWSPTSIASENVADEARLAKTEKKLVNALFRTQEPPFPFEAINGLPLDGWTGREPHNGWTRLVRTLDDQLAHAGGQPGALVKALAGREAAIEAKRREILAAESVFQVAQAQEAAANAAADAANAALRSADAQIRQVLDLKGSGALLRVAQSELDAALTARDEAEAATKTATGGIASASLALTRARAELEGLFEPRRAPAPPPDDPPPIGRPKVAEAPPTPAEPAESPPREPPATVTPPSVSAVALVAGWRNRPVIVISALASVLAAAVIWTIASRSPGAAPTTNAATNAPEATTISAAGPANPPAPTVSSGAPSSSFSEDPYVKALLGVWSESSSQCLGLIVRVSLGPDGVLNQTTIMDTTDHATIESVSPDGLVQTKLADGTPRFYRLVGDTITTSTDGKGANLDELHRCPDDTPLNKME